MEDEFGSFSSALPPLKRNSDGSFGSFSAPLASTDGNINIQTSNQELGIQKTESPLSQQIPEVTSQGKGQEHGLEQVRKESNTSSVSSLTRRLSLVSTEISLHTRVSVSMPMVDTKYTSLPTVHWTDPNLFYNLITNDSIAIALNKNLSFSELPARKLMSVEEALAGSQDKDPFLRLVESNSWTSIANLAKHALISCHPSQIEDIMRLWMIRLSALYKLGLADVMELELGKLGDLDSSQYLYENYKDLLHSEDSGDKQGSMVPLEIKIISTLIYSLRGDHAKTLSFLYKLLYGVRMQSLVGKKQGLCPQFLIKTHITNCLLKMEDYENALHILDSLALYYTEHRPVLWSSIGRIHLFLGDLSKAKGYFDQVETQMDSLKKMNSALLCIAKKEWDQAYKILVSQPQLSFKLNASIVLLYQGFSKKAVTLLEQCIKENPFKLSRSQDVIFNLCTLYDLLDCSTDRKRDLLKNILSKYASEDFKVECIKI